MKKIKIFFTSESQNFPFIKNGHSTWRANKLEKASFWTFQLLWEISWSVVLSRGGWTEQSETQEEALLSSL